MNFFKKLEREIELSDLIDESNDKKFEKKLDLWFISVLDRGINLFPKSPRLYFVRGVLKFKYNSLEEALNDFTKTDSLLNSSKPSPIFYRGLVFFRLKEFEKSREEYNKAIRLDSNNVTLYFFRALVYEKLNEHKRAIEDLDQSIKICPTSSRLYNHKAVIRMNSDLTCAIEDFNKAIELNPNEGTFSANRAVLKNKLGDYLGAERDFINALNLGYKNVAGLLRRRGLNRESLGDYEGAKSDLLLYEKLNKLKEK